MKGKKSEQENRNKTHEIRNGEQRNHSNPMHLSKVPIKQKVKKKKSFMHRTVCLMCNFQNLSHFCKPIGEIKILNQNKECDSYLSEV